jgi:Protein of unknown function (DUF4232)
MIAPPRPPPHDELEALIKEARARQLRRRLLGAAGVAITAALGLCIYAFLIEGTGKTTVARGGRPQAGVGCGAAGGWSLSLSSGWAAEPTGQHTAPVVLKRLGSTPCTLTGYPKVVLLDAHRRPLGFRYSHRGDSVVARRPALPVRIGANGSAFFLLNKYRCDLRALSTARWLRLTLPGVRGALTLRLSHYPILDYCPADPPSRTIAVSPIVGSFAQAATRLP